MKIFHFPFGKNQGRFSTCKMLLALLLSVLALSVFVPQTFAQRERVLGLVDDKPSIPPTIEGPGFLLPDSPFYFLDKLKQSVRIAFAIGPEQRIQVYESIAGERLAEARFELIKNNVPAALVALQGVADNSRHVGEFMQKAQTSGRNESKLAGDINSSIKQHQLALDFLEQRATGELEAEVNVVQAALADAKIIVEDSLPQELLIQEVHEDLLRDAMRQALNTQDAALSLQQSLSLLQQQASEAAKQNVTNHDQARTSVVQNVQTKQTPDEIRQEAMAKALQAQASADITEIVEKAKSVAQTVETAQEVVSSKN